MLSWRLLPRIVLFQTRTLLVLLTLMPLAVLLLIRLSTTAASDEISRKTPVPWLPTTLLRTRRMSYTDWSAQKPWP